MKKYTHTALVVFLIIVILATFATSAAAIPSPVATPPAPQHVLLETGGTVYVLGDCHMSMDINGKDSLQITCEDVGK